MVTPASRVRQHVSVALSSLLCFAPACSPTTLLAYPLPGSEHDVAVVERGGEHWVLTPEEQYGPFAEVALDATRISPDGRRLAWAASAGDHWRVYLDGKPGPPWDGVAELMWSPTSRGVVYAAKEGDGWRVVTARGVGPRHDALASGSLRACGDTAAYVALDRDAEIVVVGQRTLGPHADVEWLTVDPKCAGLAFVSREAGRVYVHVGERRFGPFLDVAQIAISPDGRRTAASVLGEEGWRVLLDGELSEPFAVIGTLLFSVDGLRVAYAAMRPDEGDAWYVRTGQRTLGPFEHVPHHSLTFSVAGQLAFSATIQGRQRVVLDEEPLEGDYDEIARLTFASSSPRLGFVGVRDGTAEIVIDGEQVARHRRVEDLVLSPNGQRYLAAVASETDRALVVDGMRFPLAVVAGTLTFDDTGRRWGALVADGTRPAFFFVLDGRRGPTVELVELRDWIRYRGLDGSERLAAALRQWVRAELRASRAFEP